ncbi:MAG TPA: hypothetical protein DEB31_05765, partial [Clostridiales bacterium]|nr:hypothetical protein [Clostridiales bacterium]
MKKGQTNRWMKRTAAVAAASLLLLCAATGRAQAEALPVEVPDAYEPNDIFGDATELGVPTDIRATISNNYDQDYYAFTMPSGSRARITLTQPDDGDVYYSLRLFDADYNKMDIALGAGTHEILRYLAPGRYYAMVDNVEDVFSLPAGFCSQAEYGLKIETLPLETYDFSEYNLVNAAFHPESRFQFTGRNQLTAGSVYIAAACLSRWDGYLEERQDPYILYYDEYDLADRNLSYYHTGNAAWRLKDIIMLPPRADTLDNEYYKNALYTYGALYCGIQEQPEFYGGNKAYYYHPAGVVGGSGHAITIVGWDDSVPKESFQITTEDGQTHMPAHNGAFIAKNSYGAQTGDRGFFYISYCSADFSNNAASAMVARPAQGGANVLYMHDPYGYTGVHEGWTGPRGKEIWAKNVFTAPADQTLKSVSFYALGMDQSYDIYVDTGGGAVLAASGVNRHAGYYTVDIANEIALESGVEFSVTVWQANIDGNDIEAALERKVAGFSDAAASSPGQGFLSCDGQEWQDVSVAFAANNCIKVYAHDGAAQADVVITEETGNAGTRAQAMEEEITEPPAQAFAVGADERKAMIDVPASFDLRETGAVTSVKNQGNPPTCWTFATMGSTESILLKAASGFDTGVSVSLDAARREVDLNGSGEGYATAVVRQNGGSGEVYWQFSGDTQSIEVQKRVSVSGERAVLFTARQEGEVTATAVSADDGTKAAEIVFTTRKNEPQPTAEPTPAPSAEQPTPAPSTAQPT